jgi:hypothetical protein
VTITLHVPADKQDHLIRAMWRVNQRGFFGYWALGAIFTLCGALAFTEPRAHTFAFVSLVIGLFTLAAPSYTIWRYRRRLPNEPSKIIINEDRVFIESPSSNSDFAWTLINSVLETPDSFIIRQGRAIRVVAPKDQLADDDLRAFRRLLRNRQQNHGLLWIEPAPWAASEDS